MLVDLLSSGPYALALSPGFFCFYALAGALHALEDEGCLNPSHISGSSAGALVGGFVAAGLNPCEVITSMLAIKREDIWDLGGIGGLLRGQLFQSLLEKLLPVKKIEDCHIPLGVTGWEVFGWQTKLVTSGDLATAIRASCTFPLLFQPVSVDGTICIDGGVFDDAGLMALPGVPESQLIVNVINGRGRVGSSVLPEKYAHARLLTLVLDHMPLVTPFTMETQGLLAYRNAKKAMHKALHSVHIQQLGPRHWCCFIDGAADDIGGDITASCRHPASPRGLSLTRPNSYGFLGGSTPNSPVASSSSSSSSSCSSSAGFTCTINNSHSQAHRLSTDIHSDADVSSLLARSNTSSDVQPHSTQDNEYTCTSSTTIPPPCEDFQSISNTAASETVVNSLDQQASSSLDDLSTAVSDAVTSTPRKRAQDLAVSSDTPQTLKAGRRSSKKLKHHKYAPLHDKLANFNLCVVTDTCDLCAGWDPSTALGTGDTLALLTTCAEAEDASLDWYIVEVTEAVAGAEDSASSDDWTVTGVQYDLPLSEAAGSTPAKATRSRRLSSLSVLKNKNSTLTLHSHKYLLSSVDNAVDGSWMLLKKICY